MTRILNVVSLVDGDDTEDGAVSKEFLKEGRISNQALLVALTRALKPFASVIKEGYGVAIIVTNDGGPENVNASIVGVKDISLN